MLTLNARCTQEPSLFMSLLLVSASDPRCMSKLSPVNVHLSNQLEYEHGWFFPLLQMHAVSYILGGASVTPVRLADQLITMRR